MMSSIILDAALKASILLLLAWGATTALRGSSAALRHFVWSLAVFGALAMPLFSGIVPVALPLPVLAEVSEPDVAAPTGGPHPAGAPERAAVSSSVSETAVSGVAMPFEAVVPAAVAPAAAATPSEGLGIARRLSGAGGFLPLAWGAGCVLALLWLGIELLRLRSISRRSEIVTRGPIANAARLPALHLRLGRMPTLLLGPDDAIPMTWGITRAFVLLPGSARRWDDARLEAVLLHEFGHVRRRDFAIQVVARLACALYWFNPLAWIATHRLQVEREFACDDLVVSSGHQPFGYADSLVELARSLRTSMRPPAVGSVAAGMVRPGQLRDRLVSILDDTRDRRSVSPRVGVAFAACTLVLAGILAAVAPVPAAGSTLSAPGDDTAATQAGMTPAAASGTSASTNALPKPNAVSNSNANVNAVSNSNADAKGSESPEDEAWTLALCGKADSDGGSRSWSHHHETDEDVVRLTVEFDRCKSSVEIKGEVSFTRDFTAIERMESGSRLHMEVDRDGEPERRLEARPGSDGRPEYRWWIDGRERDFDADARAWLSDALVDLFRSSSYMAHRRATWIFSSGGASAVFAEIQAMSSDHVQGIYLEALLDNPSASTDDVRRAVGLAGSEIESDHALGKVLEAAATHRFDDATRDAWLSAARRIESDHSQGKVFEAALARNDLSTANLGFILDAVADDIESDHTAGKVYEGLLGHELSSQAMGMLIASAASIESDHTLSKLLERVLAHDIDEASQLALLRVARGVQSDHALGKVLERFAGRYELSGRVATAYEEAVSTIDSSNVRRKLART